MFEVTDLVSTYVFFIDIAVPALAGAAIGYQETGIPGAFMGAYAGAAGGMVVGWGTAGLVGEGAGLAVRASGAIAALRAQHYPVELLNGKP